MRVIVTGAQGFVGKALAARLAADGHEVVAVGRRTAPGLVTADLGTWGWTAALPERADAVIHLAQSRLYGSFPDGGPDMVRVNVDSTAELLDWSRRAGVQTFVLASTGNVYAPSDAVLTEDSPCRPTGLYPATKFAAEQLAASYGGLFRVTVARLFGIYGPGQESGLFRTLLNRVRGGQAVTLAAGCGLRITPLYLDDCAAALAAMAGVTGGAPTVVNLGGVEATDVRTIAEEMGRAGGWTPTLEETRGPAPSLTADSSLAQRLFSWRPDVTLADGVRRMVAAERTA